MLIYQFHLLLAQFLIKPNCKGDKLKPKSLASGCVQVVIVPFKHIQHQFVNHYFLFLIYFVPNLTLSSGLNFRYTFFNCLTVGNCSIRSFILLLLFISRFEKLIWNLQKSNIFQKNLITYLPLFLLSWLQEEVMTDIAFSSFMSSSRLARLTIRE